MKSLPAKPQEWKAAAQAYLAQKAPDAFHAQERSSASLPAAGLPDLSFAYDANGNIVRIEDRSEGLWMKLLGCRRFKSLATMG